MRACASSYERSSSSIRVPKSVAIAGEGYCDEIRCGPGLGVRTRIRPVGELLEHGAPGSGLDRVEAIAERAQRRRRGRVVAPVGGPLDVVDLEEHARPA